MAFGSPKGSAASMATNIATKNLGLGGMFAGMGPLGMFAGPAIGMALMSLMSGGLTPRQKAERANAMLNMVRQNKYSMVPDNENRNPGLTNLTQSLKYAHGAIAGGAQEFLDPELHQAPGILDYSDRLQSYMPSTGAQQQQLARAFGQKYGGSAQGQKLIEEHLTGIKYIREPGGNTYAHLTGLGEHGGIGGGR